MGVASAVDQRVPILPDDHEKGRRGRRQPEARQGESQEEQGDDFHSVKGNLGSFSGVNNEEDRENQLAKARGSPEPQQLSTPECTPSIHALPTKGPAAGRETRAPVLLLGP